MLISLIVNEVICATYSRIVSTKIYINTKKIFRKLEAKLKKYNNNNTVFISCFSGKEMALKTLKE